MTSFLCLNREVAMRENKCKSSQCSICISFP